MTNNQSNVQKSELIAFQSYEDPNEGVKKACTIPVKIIDSSKMFAHLPIVKKHDFYYNIQNVRI